MQTQTDDPLPFAPVEHEATPRRYILVPLDGSVAAESILAHAAQLAHFAHCSLLLLYVIGPPSLFESISPSWNYYPQADSPDEAQWARDYLARIAARWQTAGVPIRSVIAHGRPGPTIIAVTKRFPGIIMLAMATHVRPSFLLNLLSPVLSFVIRETAIPVFLMKTHHARSADTPRPAYGVIAVPLDIPMRTGEALAKALLIAQATGGTLVLATFSSKHAETTQALHIAQWSKATLEPTPSESGVARDLRMRKIAVPGRLSQALLRFCRQEHPDILVIAPKDCRHFTPRWLVGVSRRIMRDLAIPVLVVPPEA